MRILKQTLSNIGRMKLKTRLKSHNCGELNLSNENTEVVLSGWVSTVRDLGGILFIKGYSIYQILRDEESLKAPYIRLSWT